MQKKVLFLLFKRYRGILEGGGVVNQQNLKMARDLFGEDNVKVVYVHDEYRRRSLWSYALAILLFPFGYHNGVTPFFIRNIVAEAGEYDFVFFGTSLLGIIAKKLRKAGYKGKIISYFHNVESIYYDAVIPKHIPFRSVVINCAKRNDGYSCKYSDRIIVLNNRDAGLIHNLHGRKPDVIMPVVMKDRLNVSCDTALTRKRPLCMFIGSCFPANSEGVLWFVKNVLPFVDIDFMVVGKGMAKLKSEYKCMKDIEVKSDVPDLGCYFYEADFMVLPIFSGSGMKIKTCEAMMYGKNIIGTDETFEGYDVDYEKIGGKCNTASEYIECIKRYIENPVPRFNKYSRNVFLEHHSEEVVSNEFKSALEFDD